MEIINQVKDPETLYQSGLVYHDDGRIECPVCSAMYKRKGSAEKHYAKQDCYRVVDLFADTPYEEAAFGLYQSIIEEKNPKARVTLNSFRKSKTYSSTVRFTVFCYIHEVEDFGLYYSYMTTIRNLTIPNAAMSAAMNEEELRDYRIFLHRHFNYVDSREFWDRHGDLLLSDEDFFIRSLEKAHITLNSVKVRRKAREFASKLPYGYALRYTNLVKKVMGEE